MQKSNRKLIVSIVAVLVTALVASGIGLGTVYVANKLTEGDESTVYVPDGNISTTPADVITDDSVEIPEVVKGTPMPGEGYDNLVDLYDKCSQSCVSILCTVEYKYNYGFYQGTEVGQSLGSGFILEGEEGGELQYYIITNHHVVEDAKTIDVKFYDSEEMHEATLIGSDEATDIAVLTIERTDLVPLAMGNSDECKVGQWVVAIGSPMDIELEGTMSYGIISGLDRRLDITGDSGSVIKP